MRILIPLILLCGVLLGSLVACSSSGGATGDAVGDGAGDASADGLGFVISEAGENAVTLDWIPVPGAERYEIWVLEVRHIDDIVDFPEAPWAVRWEPAGPPFEVARALDRETELRCVLRALAGDAVLAEAAEVLIVSPARRPMPPVIAVGDGVAWIGWDPGTDGASSSILGDPVDWQVLRDGALIDTIPPNAGAYDHPVGYLDVSGVLTGQTVSYQVGRLTNDGETGPESEPAAARIEAWTGLDALLEHACARAASGAAYCWGVNASAQLGGGDLEEHLGAVRVLGPGGEGFLEGVVDVTVGAETSCALLAGGGVSCWGRSLLLPANVSLHPEALDLGAAVEDIELGAAFACGLAGGQLRCAGANDFGQLGRGDTGEAPQAAAPALDPDGAGPLSGIVEWGAGLRHACARVEAGDVYCWGDASDGQLGLGEVGAPVSLPGRVDVDGVQALWVGPLGACASTVDDHLWCWGPDWSQQNTMTGEGPSSPRDIGLGDALLQGEVIVVAAPGEHSLVVTSLGRVFEFYRWTGYSWETCDEEAFAPPFAGTTLLAKGDGYGCLLNRDGLLACRAWCNPGVPYNADYYGCAGFRAGTRGLNTAQRAHAVRVFMDPVAP